MVDVDGLQSPRTEVLEPVRNASRPQNGLPGGGVDHLGPHKEPRPADQDDEGLVIGMHMQARPLARRVVAIGQHGDRPAQPVAVERATPCSSRLRVEEGGLGGYPPVGRHRGRVEIPARHLLPP